MALKKKKFSAFFNGIWQLRFTNERMKIVCWQSFFVSSLIMSSLIKTLQTSFCRQQRLEWHSKNCHNYAFVFLKTAKYNSTGILVIIRIWRHKYSLYVIKKLVAKSYLWTILWIFTSHCVNILIVQQKPFNVRKCPNCLVVRFQFQNSKLNFSDFISAYKISYFRHRVGLFFIY